MARDHARILVRIWDDDDFCALDVGSQHMYLMLATAKRLSYCGVLDYLPSRLAGKAKGLTEAKVKTAVKTLERARFVVLDKATQEILVRSYVRYDGVLNRLNMGKAVASALDRVESEKVRQAVRVELARLSLDEPALAGWHGFKAQDPSEFEAVAGIASAMQSAMQSAIESGIESPIESAMQSAMASRT